MTSRLLGELLQQATTVNNNPVNNLTDVHNIKVLVWTNSKCGTTALSEAFQRSIDGTIYNKNVVHCHSEACWNKCIFEEQIPEISTQLKSIFNFDVLIEFINSCGIKPLVVQSFRNPFKRVISHTNATNQTFQQAINYSHQIISIPGLYDCEFDKMNGFGFQSQKRYNILYTTVESFPKLSQNIKTIDALSDYHDITIRKRNIAHGKNPVNYAELKKTCKWSPEYVDIICDKLKSQIEFYYSAEQFEQMKRDALNQ